MLSISGTEGDTNVIYAVNIWDRGRYQCDLCCQYLGQREIPNVTYVTYAVNIWDRGTIPNVTYVTYAVNIWDRGRYPM